MDCNSLVDTGMYCCYGLKFEIQPSCVTKQVLAPCAETFFNFLTFDYKVNPATKIRLRLELT